MEKFIIFLIFNEIRELHCQKSCFYNIKVLNTKATEKLKTTVLMVMVSNYSYTLQTLPFFSDSIFTKKLNVFCHYFNRYKHFKILMSFYIIGEFFKIKNYYRNFKKTYLHKLQECSKCN